MSESALPPDVPPPAAPPAARPPSSAAPTHEPAQPAPAEPPPAPPARGARLPVRLADWLAARGAGPAVLSGFALILAGLAAGCFVVIHPGLGGVLGLLAIGAGGLATVVGPEGPRPGTPLARGLTAAVDWILLSAVLTGAAAAHLLLRVLLGVAVLCLHAWLPQLSAAEQRGDPSPRLGLWHRSERLGVVLLGAIVGPIDVALILVMAVGALDATLRIGRLSGDGDGARGPAFLRPLLTEEGDLEPVVRWGSLLLAVLLLAVLSRLLAPEGGWPF